VPGFHFFFTQNLSADQACLILCRPEPTHILFLPSGPARAHSTSPSPAPRCCGDPPPPCSGASPFTSPVAAEPLVGAYLLPSPAPFLPVSCRPLPRRLRPPPPAAMTMRRAGSSREHLRTRPVHLTASPSTVLASTTLQVRTFPSSTPTHRNVWPGFRVPEWSELRLCGRSLT
jgi:hypothetical protein